MGYKKLKKLKAGKPWKRDHSFNVGTFAVNVIAHRTFDQGKDVRDRGFKPYSKKAIYIPTKGVMPKPKGGKLSRTGKSMLFERGYRQYKFRALGYARVTLTASGALRRSFRVLKVSRKRDQVSIGIAGDPRLYGLAINETREWIGVSPKDRVKIRRYFKRVVDMVFRRPKR